MTKFHNKKYVLPITFWKNIKLSKNVIQIRDANNFSVNKDGNIDVVVKKGRN